MATKIHVEPAHGDGHRPVRAASNEEERSVLQLRIIMDSNQDSKASNRNANPKNRKRESMSELVGKVRNHHTEPERSGPGRHAVQLRLDGRVTVALDDAWRKVRVAVRRHDQAKVHEAAEEDFEVLEDVDYVVSCDFTFGG